MKACADPRAGGQPGSLLARRGQAQGFDSLTHIARPARNTGDGAQGTAHHQAQIHDGEGGIGELRVPHERNGRHLRKQLSDACGSAALFWCVPTDEGQSLLLYVIAGGSTTNAAQTCGPLRMLVAPPSNQDTVVKSLVEPARC